MSNFGTSPIYLISPSNAETRLFWETRSPVFHEEGFRVSEPFQSWEIAQKMHIRLCSPNIKSAGLGLRVTCLLFLRHEGISRSPAFIYVYDTLPWETLHKHTNQRRNSDLSMTATLHANSKISLITWFCYVHGNSEWITTTLHGLVSTKKIQFHPISNETLCFSTPPPPQAFCYKMVHCEIFVRCTEGFMRWLSNEINHSLVLSHWYTWLFFFFFSNHNWPT